MKAKKLRVERFLNEMVQVVQGPKLEEFIQPNHKITDGRPPDELRVMLLIHFLQLWKISNDLLMEEALYDRLSFQTFLGFYCFGCVILDVSNICWFRHLWEEHGVSH